MNERSFTNEGWSRLSCLLFVAGCTAPRTQLTTTAMRPPSAPADGIESSRLASSAATSPTTAPAQLAGATALSGSCPRTEHVAALDSHWFMLLGSCEELSGAIQAIDDATLDPNTDIGCGKTTSGNYFAPDAHWSFAPFGTKVLVVREVRGAPLEPFSIDTRVVGTKVIGMRSARDFSCPGNSADDCHQGDNSVLVCDSDLKRTCVPNGRQGTLELFDTTAGTVHRLESFRHEAFAFSDLKLSASGLKVGDRCVLSLE